MEYYWTLLNNSNGSSSTNTVRGHNGSFTPNLAWELPTTARPEWTFYTPPPAATGGGGSSTTTSSSLYRNPVDPHLTCLKLGKRHYFEDPAAAAGVGMAKKGKSSPVAEAVVPRCQVEGCEAVLVNAKDYHRRHKVCEMHAKAPKVVLLGIDQRFCQQCSRFHVLAEFDEAKRSCRRRLAGHNERRRKTSQADHNSIAIKHYQGRHPYPHPHPHPHSQLVNNSECALSLLSPTNYAPWNASDLPARCSAALRELIVENRAYNHLGSTNRAHVTLNLMQCPDSAFGLLSAHDHHRSEEGQEDGDGDCSHLWKLPLGY